MKRRGKTGDPRETLRPTETSGTNPTCEWCNMIQLSLPYGVASAPAVILAIMDQVVGNIPMVTCYLDDSFVAGTDDWDCKQKVKEVLKRLKAAGKEHCTVVQSLALSGDDVLDKRVEVSLIALALHGFKCVKATRKYFLLFRNLRPIPLLQTPRLCWSDWRAVCVAPGRAGRLDLWAMCSLRSGEGNFLSPQRDTNAATVWVRWEIPQEREREREREREVQGGRGDRAKSSAQPMVLSVEKTNTASLRPAYADVKWGGQAQWQYQPLALQREVVDALHEIAAHSGPEGGVCSYPYLNKARRRVDDTCICPSPFPFYLASEHFVGRVHSAVKLHVSLVSPSNVSAIHVWSNTRLKGRGKRGIPEKNPPTTGIVQHDSHLRESGVTRPGMPHKSGNRAGRYRWSAGLLGDLPFHPPLHYGTAPYSPHFTLIVFQDLDCKSCPNISTPLTHSERTEQFASSFLDKIDVKHIYNEVYFEIGSQFIRHALDDSEPIADLQGNT
ncbi:hypothetical protein PR048_022176 [Dryococelus australis]|uniref:Reverse transcriptase domain-containing protein n=1 Tax=Dryococelus australis TaxID=614101 RepID=A0ABQ9H0B5_9NEOP|nr:hypothetical protein PR048_022176 [Dryococelus australis]